MRLTSDAPVKAKPATKDTHQKEQPKKDIKGSERDDEDDEHDEFMARAEAKKGAK